MEGRAFDVICIGFAHFPIVSTDLTVKTSAIVTHHGEQPPDAVIIIMGNGFAAILFVIESVEVESEPILCLLEFGFVIVGNVGEFVGVDIETKASSVFVMKLPEVTEKSYLIYGFRAGGKQGVERDCSVVK